MGHPMGQQKGGDIGACVTANVTAKPLQVKGELAERVTAFVTLNVLRLGCECYSKCYRQCYSKTLTGKGQTFRACYSECYR